MKTKSDLRHAQEYFLLLLVDQELSPYDAYGKAYPQCKVASIPAACSRLLRNVKVQERKAQLEGERALVVRGATRVTAGFITAELQDIALKAKVAKQHAAAVAAMLGIAKLHGLLVEKHQVDAIVRRPSLNPDGPDMISEDQWLQEFSPITIEHNSEVAQPEEGELSEDTTDD
jgi:phage terminase small subunit